MFRVAVIFGLCALLSRMACIFAITQMVTDIAEAIDYFEFIFTLDKVVKVIEFVVVAAS